MELAWGCPYSCNPSKHILEKLSLLDFFFGLLAHFFGVNRCFFYISPEKPLSTIEVYFYTLWSNSRWGLGYILGGDHFFCIHEAWESIPTPKRNAFTCFQSHPSQKILRWQETLPWTVYQKGCTTIWPLQDCLESSLQELGCSSGTECLPGIHKALGSSPAPQKMKKRIMH